jgi:hypothetical protein
VERNPHIQTITAFLRSAYTSSESVNLRQLWGHLTRDKKEDSAIKKGNLLLKAYHKGKHYAKYFK